MDRSDEEAEHSIEMQLPFIAKVMHGYYRKNNIFVTKIILVNRLVIVSFPFFILKLDTFRIRTLRNSKSKSLVNQFFILKRALFSRKPTIIPVLVGSLQGSKQQTYGKIFAHYLENPRNLFVISSDFCHFGRAKLLNWEIEIVDTGDRFNYAPYDRSSGVPIYEQISNLDRAVKILMILSKSNTIL